MKKPILSIIIINYNTPELVYQCLSSIKKYVKVSYEIILVDNGSKNDLELQKNKTDNILEDTEHQILMLKDNLGFGGGNNAGAQKATGKYLWLLNSDTILKEDSPKKMIRFLDDHPEIGALLPLLIHKNGETQKYLFAKFQTLGSIIFRRYGFNRDKLLKNPDNFFYTDIVVGAALMIKRELFEKIGGFDENIFMFLEDDDLCKRIEEAGFRNALLKSTKVIHLEGKSIKNNKFRKRLYYASQTYFWNKHNGFWPTLVMRIIRWPYKLIKTNFD